MMLHDKALVGKPGKVMNAIGCVAQGFKCIVRGFLFQYARSGYHVVFGQGNAHIEGAKVGVKLAQVEVRHGRPAFGVVHRRFGVPLSDLVGLPHAAEARKRGRYLEGERGFNDDRLPREQGFGQLKQGYVGVVLVGREQGRHIIHPEIQAGQAAEFFVLCEVETGIFHTQSLPCESRMAAAVRVGPEVKQDGLQRVRRMV